MLGFSLSSFTALMLCWCTFSFAASVSFQETGSGSESRSEPSRWEECDATVQCGATRFGRVRLWVNDHLTESELSLNDRPPITIPDSQRLAFPERVFRTVDPRGNPIDLVVLSSTSGTSCAATLRVLEVSEEAFRVSGEFGNCSEHYAVVVDSDSLQFLFSCACSHSCYDRYYPYRCSYIPGDSIRCDGQEYCHRDACGQGLQRFFKIDWEQLADGVPRLGTGRVSTVRCRTESGLNR